MIPRRMVLTGAAALGLFPRASAAMVFAYEGWGAAGSDDIVTVTSLRDSGPGTLREALGTSASNGSNRTIRFNVAGSIPLVTDLRVFGNFVTIDGLSAPAPGITITGKGLLIRQGVHDIIVSGLRVRGSYPYDCIQVYNGCSNVIIDHCSVGMAGDGLLDITGEGTNETHHVTISYCILGNPSQLQNQKWVHKAMLVKYRATRVSVHHCLFMNSLNRNPQVDTDDANAVYPDMTLDFRCNLIGWWGPGNGSTIYAHPKVNFVKNYYTANGGAGGDIHQAILTPDAPAIPLSQHAAYLAENESHNPFTFPVCRAEPYDAPEITEEATALDAAWNVVRYAGCRGAAIQLDAYDRALITRAERDLPS